MVTNIRRVSGPLALFAALIGLGFALNAFQSAASPAPKEIPVLEAPTPAVFGPLVPPKVQRKGGPRAFASAYVHRENCIDALLGANGDNDIAAAINKYDFAGYTIQNGTSRFSATRVAIPISFSGTGRGTFPNGYGTFGYCMGDDPSIVDNAVTPPSGW